MYIVYNCGYHSSMRLKGPVTGRQYAFAKKFVTKVDDSDGEAFLKMTADNIQWCPTNDKSLLPFMSLEDFCDAKEGRFNTTGNQNVKYDPKKYLEAMSLGK